MCYRGNGAVTFAASVRSLALFQFLEPELIVFLYFPHLLLHLQKLEVQFLDLARKLPDLFFQLADTRIAGLSHQNRRIA